MKTFLDRFLEMGFKQAEPEHWTGSGWAMSYKYYPIYLIDKHYTLITFTYGEEAGIRDNTEYRLYTHYNDKSGYVDCKFDLSYHKDWNKNYLDNKFKEIFKIELRNRKLNEILND